MLYACMPDPVCSGFLNLKNGTDDTLLVKHEIMDVIKKKEILIVPDGALTFAQARYVGSKDRDFTIEDFIADADSSEISIYSSDGKRFLAKWTYQGRNKPGKQFFNIDHYTVHYGLETEKPIWNKWYYFIITQDMLTGE